jgi:peptidoglycan/xylan/chitin deacetylase (PgdA/CDA1 family)
MYHHIQDLPPNASRLRKIWTVAPTAFEAQMQYLAQNHYNAISVAQLVAYFQDGQPLPAKPIIITFDDAWLDQYTVAFPILVKYGLRGTFFIPSKYPDHGATILTWAQVLEMDAAGMEFGSHTIGHRPLAGLAREVALYEIRESKRVIENRLGHTTIALAYPNGSYDAAVIELLRENGYRAAVTIAGGYKQNGNDLFRLRRIPVSYADSLEDFIARLPQ